MDRILEIGQFAAGFAGRLFVQSRHEVVRIEPGSHAPGWVSQQALDLFLHPGKQRLGVNDTDLIRSLADKADVVIVEAETADALEDMGFDNWLAPVKVSITPFGRTGPKRNWRATPAVLLAMGGYTNIMGDAGRAPLTLPGHYVEFQSGQYGYTAANACRLAGQSNTIDVSMLEVIMSLSQFTTVMWHCMGEIRQRHGSEFWTVPPTNLFRCQDGWIYVNIVPGFWEAFCIFLEMPELVIDERFTTNDDRMANREELQKIIREVVSQLTREEAQNRATQCRIPLGVVQTLDEVLYDPHLEAREFWQSVTSQEHEVLSPSLPFRFDHSPRPGFELKPVEGES